MWRSIIKRLQLHELKPAPGSNQHRKIVGRGNASGHGNTSGKGQKGQKSRAGYNVSIAFEGGQTPFNDRVPALKFLERAPKETMTRCTLESIEYAIALGKLDPSKPIKIRDLHAAGLIKNVLKTTGVRIVHEKQDEIPSKISPIHLEASKATPRAIRTIEASGGSFTARFFTSLGLRVHLKPEDFTYKIPRLVGPTKDIDIEYYTNPVNRGYLAPYYRLVDAPDGKLGKVLVNVKTLDMAHQIPTYDALPVPEMMDVMETQRNLP